jgi:hypothetical protein
MSLSEEPKINASKSSALPEQLKKLVGQFLVWKVKRGRLGDDYQVCRFEYLALV